MMQETLTLKHLRHLDPETFFHAYGVDLQMLYPWEEVVEPPFGAAWATLAPGNSTKRHQHQEAETFFIAKGQGEMTIDGDTFEVTQGSVIFQRPFEQHVLTNTSKSDDLLFLTVWWEDRRLWTAREDQHQALEEAEGSAPQASTPKRVMVTAAPPTPNGDLHLGHFSGPYLGADFHSRYLRLRGIEGSYACGTDDHCMFVERRGEQLGMDGEAAATHFANAITESLESAGLDLALFIRPGESSFFRPRVLEFFDRLYRSGKLEVREAESPYCERCDLYLFEADISGLCQDCESTVTGNTCEDCGRVNDCINLRVPRCNVCGDIPTTRVLKRLVFPLAQYTERLRDYHNQTHMSVRLRSFCERYMSDGLPEVAVSHFSSWGIPVPLEGTELDQEAFSQQTLYVWFEMAARYLVYAEHLADQAGSEESFRHYWQSNEASIVQFFGFDNSFYYSMFLPALYMAYDEDLKLPEAFVTNEFYRLDNLKFSTTRQHAILGRELFGVVPRDTARFFLAHSAPEREGTNFTISEFASTVERELPLWDAWLGELGEKTQREFEGAVPATGDWTEEHREFYDQLKALVETADAAYRASTFSPQRATRALCELVRISRRFGKAEDHWRGVPDREQERRTGVALELLAAKTLAVLACPIMPHFAARLWRDLGFAGDLPSGVWEDDLSWVPGAQTLGSLGGDRYFMNITELLAKHWPEPKQE